MSAARYRSILVFVVFLAMLAFPFLNDSLRLIKDTTNTENRQMAKKPDFNVSFLDPYPQQYDKYFNDNFPLRFLLVNYYNKLNLKVFKKSPLPGRVVIGNDGWLFDGWEQLDSYKGDRPLKTADLESIRLELEFRQKYLESRHCKFYFIVAPTKVDIYPEKMPINIFRYSKESWGEQVINYLNKYSTVKPIDLYTLLRSKKDSGLLYYKLDTHWNELGAFYAANEILKRIHADIPEIMPLSLNNFNVKITEKNGGNISGMISDTTFSDEEYTLTPKNGYQAADVAKVGYPVIEDFAYPTDYEFDREIKGSKKPRLLFISDSFGINLFHLFSEDFSRTVKIFDSWQYRLNEDIVAGEKPDVVILEGLATGIPHILNNQARLKGIK